MLAGRQGRVHGASRRELQAGAHPGPARRFPGQGVARRPDGDPRPAPKADIAISTATAGSGFPPARVFYSPSPGDAAPQELAFAQAHFFLPHRYQDPFGNNTVVAYDAKYNLLLVSTRDAVGNETSAEHDYRVLQPDNGHRSQRQSHRGPFRRLGHARRNGRARQGDRPGRRQFLRRLHDRSRAGADHGLLRRARPPRARRHLSRHGDDPHPLRPRTRPGLRGIDRPRDPCQRSRAGQQTEVQLHFVYSDGFGREAQTKVQAEPGPLDLGDPNSPIANPRWVGTGEKVYNNKGKPVRQYEPFFSATPQFGIEKWGVSSTLFYDPVERVVATLHPNNTFEKVVFDPWQQTTYDVNDTVTFDPKTDPDVGDFFSRLPDADYLPTWYQQRDRRRHGP